MNGQIVYTKESEENDLVENINKRIFQCLLFLNLDRKLILLKYKSYHKCSGIINKYFYP